MRWPATERFALKAAPHSVGLIQDFLMTGDPEGRLQEADLLATLEDARQWLAVARVTWSAETGLSAPEFDLDEKDLAPLRKVRDTLFAEVSNRSHGMTVDSSSLASHSASAHIDVAADGTVSLLAGGRGWRKVLSWLLLEVHRSQQDNTWQRLKACKIRNAAVSSTTFPRTTAGLGMTSVRAATSRISARAREEAATNPRRLSLGMTGGERWALIAHRGL